MSSHFPLKHEQIWTNNNQPKTRSLFSETCLQSDNPILSLNSNLSGLPFLRPTFVELTIDDPTEVNFAETVFGEFKFWMHLRDVGFMSKYLTEWREEADVKRKRKAFAAILEEVTLNGKSKFSAAKFLIDEPWKGNTKEAKVAKKATTSKAFDVYKDDVTRLQEEGLIN